MKLCFYWKKVFEVNLARFWWFLMRICIAKKYSSLLIANKNQINEVWSLYIFMLKMILISNVDISSSNFENGWNKLVYHGEIGWVKYSKCFTKPHHYVFHDWVDNGNFECSLCYINENVYKGEEYFTGNWTSKPKLTVSGGLFCRLRGDSKLLGLWEKTFVCVFRWYLMQLSKEK